MNSFTHHLIPKPIDDFGGWLASFTQASTLIELMVLLACVGLALLAVYVLRRNLHISDKTSIWFGRNMADGVLFPLVLLCLGYLARLALDYYVDAALFTLVVPVLVALVVIRTGVKVLQAAFTESPWTRYLEQTISWVVWVGMILWVSGVLPVMLNQLDQVHWKVGSSTMSIRSLIEGIVTAGAVLIIMLWISSAIERRLLSTATGGELSLRKAVSNATRALLLFVGLMVSFSAVGIDLTALSVVGGALGVGLGFGLQKLAANYVSGFVILAERSMRIGDIVKVDNFEGQITQINARYTVVRALNGRESIVPNELLITSRVENQSLQDSRVYQSTVVIVGNGSDADLVTRLLEEAARSQDRVLADPAPSAHLSSFETNGLEFTLGYWINDPQIGSMGLRSEINKGILTSLRTNGIDLPYQQVVIHKT